MNWRRECAYLGLLAAVVVGFFWQATLAGGAFFVQDVMVQNYPFRDFFARHLRGGQLPLWDPAINCGFPLLAEGQAGPLYPFNWLTSALPTHWGISLNLAFHLWLAAAGMYGLLRLWRAQAVAALTGGLAYALSGYMVVRAMSPNFVDACAWLPVLLIFVGRFVERGNGAYLLGAGAVVALQLLAGHPQAAGYGLLVGMAYGLYMGLVGRRSWSYYAALAAVPMIGVALAAVQLLPTYELTQLSVRSEGVSWQQFINMSLPPERLLELLLPNLHGNSAQGTYWGRSAGFFIQLCPFVGVLTLVLAWVALRADRREPVGFLALLAGLGLVLALGEYTGFFELLYGIPGLSFFRIPTRFLLFFTFAISALAGLGCSALLDAERRRVRGRGFVVFLAVLGASAVWLNAEVLVADGEWLAARGGSDLVRYAEHLRFDALRLFLVLVFGYALLSGWVRRGAVLFVPCILLLELYTFGGDFNAVVEPEVYKRVPPTAQAIADDHQGIAPARVISLVNEQNAPFDWHAGWAVDRSSYRRYTETLRPYSGGLYGLGNAMPGWSPLHLSRHWDFARAYPQVARVAGVEYAISYGAMNESGLRSISDGQIRVYRVVDSAPRAYIAADYAVVTDDGERLRQLQRGAASVERVLLEEQPVPGRVPAGGGHAEITRYTNEEVVVDLRDNGGGMLVLSDTYYPGWRAFVDGIERPILRANHVFRAVRVEPGARQVVFRFESSSFRMGLWVSGVGWAAWCLALVLMGRRTPQASPLHALRPLGTARSLAVACAQGVLVALLYGACTQWPLWAAAVERSRVLLGWGG